jgi:hypothetical protein
MKRSLMALMIGLAGLLTLSLLAMEKPGTPWLIRLQANGETIAEVRLFKSTELTVTGHGQKPIVLNYTSGRTVADDATIQLTRGGSKPITIKAEHIEIVSDPN